MKIKLLVDNILIGDRNYGKDDVLEYEVDGGRKAELIRNGQAIETDEAGTHDDGFKAAVPVKVEDKATLFLDDVHTDAKPKTAEGIAPSTDDLRVTATTPIKPEKK